MPETVAKPKVLVADDERVIADTLAMILNQSGFEARAVYSGEKALELAATFAPDMMISDVIMADLNGIDAAIRIRALLPGIEARRQTAAIALGLLTGGLPESQLALTISSGVDVALHAIPVGERADILRRRPDIASAERKLAAATADTGVVTAELFPKLTISASAGISSSRQQAYCCSTMRRTRFTMARNVSVAVKPSIVRSTTSLSICCLMPATRTSKNSSRFELTMQKNFTRSSSGFCRSSASSSTR